MTEADEVNKILATTSRKHDRILYFAAMLSKESGSEVVIVGGSAIEIYTRGGYVSGDIDLRVHRDRVSRVLAKWGFKDRGRLWTQDDWGLAIDIVGDQYSGDPYRATTVSTPYGPVQIAVVEDLFIKRLAAAKHWQVPEALEEAWLLWKGYRDEMDTTYLNRKAKEYHVEDLLSEIRRKRR